jgi:hypothetical protein
LRYGGVLGPPDVGDIERLAVVITSAAARSEDANQDKQEESPKSRFHKLTRILQDTFLS